MQISLPTPQVRWESLWMDRWNGGEGEHHGIFEREGVGGSTVVHIRLHVRNGLPLAERGRVGRGEEKFFDCTYCTWAKGKKSCGAICGRIQKNRIKKSKFVLCSDMECLKNEQMFSRASGVSVSSIDFPQKTGQKKSSFSATKRSKKKLQRKHCCCSLPPSIPSSSTRNTLVICLGPLTRGRSEKTNRNENT